MVWHAFGFPDRHCRGLVRVFFRAGVLVCGSDVSGLRRRLLGGGVGGSGVCWWFENWIVDASKKEFFFLFLLISNGLRDLFLGCSFGRFVIILTCCVDVSSDVFANLVFAGDAGASLVRAQWWMPWRTGPMKDVWGRDRPGGAADRALIPGSPNGGTRHPRWGGTSLRAGGYAGK